MRIQCDEPYKASSRNKVHINSLMNVKLPSFEILEAGVVMHVKFEIADFVYFSAIVFIVKTIDLQNEFEWITTVLRKMTFSFS